MRNLVARATGLLTGILLVMGIFFSTQAQSVQAATARTNSLGLTWYGDSFYKYDFLSESVAQNNVDWPLTVIFDDNATVDKVKARMQDWSTDFEYASTGSMYMSASDTNGAKSWDSDKGKKTPICPAYGSSSPHFRAYGFGSSERLYNTQIGYWVPASTHRDHSECPKIGTYFDNSEQIESLIVNQASLHTITHKDQINFSNAEPYREEGNHHWDSNGLVSFVEIP